jgi:hypothetical protein
MTRSFLLSRVAEQWLPNIRNSETEPLPKRVEPSNHLPTVFDSVSSPVPRWSSKVSKSHGISRSLYNNITQKISWPNSLTPDPSGFCLGSDGIARGYLIQRLISPLASHGHG